MHYPFLICLLVLIAMGCDRPLTFDANGVAHGTGERTYPYTSGAIKLREDYVDGELTRSRWFNPQGELVQETNWINGTGEGIYLRDDGSIRKRMPYVNGVPEGEAQEYDSAGNVTTITRYHDGRPVGDNAPSSNRVARQAANPVIAADGNLEPFIGDWIGEEGSVDLQIARNPDGSATITLPPNAAWDAVVNNAHLEGGNLRYDLYFYYKGTEDFRTITNTLGDHPFSGLQNQVTLLGSDDGKSLKEIFVTKEVSAETESTLRRRD